MLVVILLFLCRSSNTNPEHSLIHSTIGVIVPSFRDILCAETLNEVYHKAKNPSRLHVVVVEELLERDSACVNSLLEERTHSPAFVNWLLNNVRVLQKPAELQKGVHFNCFQALALLPKTDFIFRTDSHMHFLAGFDKLLVAAFNNTKDEKAVVSGWAAFVQREPYEHAVDRLPRNYTVLLPCNISVWPRLGLPFVNGIHEAKVGSVKCFAGKEHCRGLLVLGAFIFARRHFWVAVPYDPYLEHIFLGEQFLLSARAFTHGYNVYHPKRSFVFHHYFKNWRGRYKYRASVNRDLIKTKRAKNRAQKLLERSYDPLMCDDAELERYGMGKERSLHTFYRILGMNKDLGSFSFKVSYKGFCEKLMKKGIEDEIG